MQINVKKNVGPMGYADVRKLKSGIRITFKNGDAYELEDLTQLPDGFQNGEYNVSLSADASKIFGLRPTDGSYVMVVKELGNKNEGIPDTKIQRGRMVVQDNGQKYMIPDQLVWAVLLEVQANGHRFDGLTVYHQLPYIFTNVPGTNSTMLSGTKKQIERLETFLRCAGMDVSAIDIPFGPPSALLSYIENYLMQNGKPFFGTLSEKGFIDSVAVLPPQLAVSTKKKAKKS